MSRKCYAAYTPPGSSYPPYINVSRDAGSDEVTIIIRSAADKNGVCGRDATISLGPNEFRKFVDELQTALTGAAP